jgi:DNA-binding NarL/FixJ family response regulator
VYFKVGFSCSHNAEVFFVANLRIFLADGHDVLRRGLRSLLASHSNWHICGEARSGLDAVKLATKLKPDIVILGLDMPELNGIEATRQITAARPATQVLFYTVHDEEYLIVEALRAGARGHVLKSDREDTLIAAITALSKRLPYFSTRAAEALVGQLIKSGPGSNDTHVTGRERQIIQLLADGKSNKQIADQLKISVKTVEAHRSAIMRKFGFKSITELVRYAIRNGLIEP